MTEIKFLAALAVNRLVNQLRDKVKHLLGSRVFANVIVFARHNQRTPDALKNFVLAVAVETNAEDANIGAAEVKREIVARLLAARQSDVRFQHAH